MDVRRLALWEGRYATYMSNDIFSAIIEDQGDVVLELTSRALSGARINALVLPYFRGTGAGVMSDPNGEWWQSRQTLYQAGGAYFSFPSTSMDMITSSGTYWSVRRYGTEEGHGGVWRYSEMKSREAGNRYHIGKVDMLLPGHPVLYTAITRARELLIAVGDDAAVDYMIDNHRQTRRYSGLRARLAGEV